jgi:N-acetyl-anhydromuramyl-L-alanine amidase AmpD
MLFTTPPLVITDFPADAQHKGGQRRGYRWIVLHSTGGTNSKLWLSRTSSLSAPVSCHRLITKSGQIIKIVSDEEVAYTQGFARVGPLPRKNEQGVYIESMNNWSLSIEMENLDNYTDPYPAVQITACIAQCVEWIGAYGELPIVAHAWIDENKHDPAGFDWPDFYARLWQKLKAIARQ